MRETNQLRKWSKENRGAGRTFRAAGYRGAKFKPSWRGEVVPDSHQPPPVDDINERANKLREKLQNA